MSGSSGESAAGPLSVREVFRQFWPLARRERGVMLGACLLATLAVVAEAAVALVFMAITDRVLQTRDLNAFWGLAAEWLAVAVAGGIAVFGRDMLSSLSSERFLLRLRDSVFGHVQKLSPDYFAARDTGDLVARVTGDIDAVEGLVASGVVHVVSTVISVIGFAGAALYLRWDLALVSFAVAPLFWAVARGFTTPFSNASRRERAGNGAIASVVEENLTNMMLVQAYNRPESERDRVHAAGVTWLHARLAEARLAALYGPLVQFAETLCILVVLGVGAWELSTGRISLGGLLAFAAFLGMLMPPLQSLGSISVLIASARGGAERLLEVLQERPAVADLAKTGMFSIRTGHVAFDAVTFGYPERDEPALRSVSLTAAPGKLLLVTGPSGAGKSTIAKLLLRFHDPAAGAIRLDGVDIRKLTLRRLRGEVTLLLQETMLFDGTIRENIAYGAPGASDERVGAAARAADAAGFISALPQGYETLVGQRGHALSGGQRQRIAIARAILRDTPVLVLDEPTTGLDAIAAQRVIEPLRRLMAGRTTILISHDLRLAMDADEVVVLEHGRIAQRGRHSQLVATPGTYADLWSAQEHVLSPQLVMVSPPADSSLWRPA